jgi:hypothetical protein
MLCEHFERRARRPTPDDDDDDMDVVFKDKLRSVGLPL